MSRESNSRRSTYILVGLILGAILGAVARAWWGGAALEALVANVIKPIGTIFLRLIFMVVVALIISAIVLGVVELGDVRRLGRVGIRCLAMTLALRRQRGRRARRSCRRCPHLKRFRGLRSIGCDLRR